MSRGRKRNTRKDVWKYIDMNGGDTSVCWEWQRPLTGRKDQPSPYFTVDGVKYVAYRIVWEDVNGREIPEGHVIRHSCDNRKCCNPYHLGLGTHDENMKDMRDRERHGMPHHTVRLIRKLASEGKQQKEIAEITGVHKRTVSDIVQRNTYKEVSDEQ